MKYLPLVSVIVTTKNEEQNIANCLQSVREQTYPLDKIEIIVVDNSSFDNTVKIAKQFTDQIYNKGPQRASQLNLGVKKARGKYILYLDADMILSKKVIEECVDKCENEDCVALYIPERVIGAGFWIKIRDFERSFYNATCVDAVRFVRKYIFLETGGFDEELDFGPDDWDFDRRIKTSRRVGIIDSSLYHNEGKFNLMHYLKKKGYYSKTLERYIQKWGKDDPIVKRQVGASYRLLGIFIENGKRKKLIRHPLLTFGMYSLRFMVGITYLRRKK